MSQKIDRFRSALGNPIAIHNFVVRCTELLGDIDILVQSTTLPAEQLQEIILYYLGERVKWPTIATNSGRWSAVFPENENGLVNKQLLKDKGLWWEQKLGFMLPGQTANIEVVMRTVNDEEVFKVIMHNAFIIGRNDNALNSAQPTQTLLEELQFSYDWIEDVTIR